MPQENISKQALLTRVNRREMACGVILSTQNDYILKILEKSLWEYIQAK